MMNSSSETGDGVAQVVAFRPETTQGIICVQSVQSQAGWGFEQTGLVEGVTAHGREVGTRWFFCMYIKD